MLISAKEFFKRKFENKSGLYERLDEEYQFDDIKAQYFKGTKTLSYIANKRNG